MNILSCGSNGISNLQAFARESTKLLPGPPDIAAIRRDAAALPEKSDEK
jgi:hypothetical protein